MIDVIEFVHPDGRGSEPRSKQFQRAGGVRVEHSPNELRGRLHGPRKLALAVSRMIAVILVNS